MSSHLRFAAAALVLCVCTPALASIQGTPFVDDSGDTLADLLNETVDSLIANRTSPTASGIYIQPETFTGWNDGNLSLLAEITIEGGFLHYSYTFSSEALANLSHFTFEISEGAFEDILRPKVTLSGTDEETGQPFTTMPTPVPENSDGELGSLSEFFADIYKFDNGAPDGAMTAVFEFDTLRAPVFGAFFVKGGNGSAYNSGLAQLGGLVEGVDLDSATSWIPVPDSKTIIPEPVSLLVWAGLAGLVACYRIRE